MADGVYRYTRNPMYLMMLFVCAGFSIILAEAWVLALTPVCAAIIFLTAYADEQTVRRTEAVGAVGYIVKPYSRNEVRAGAVGRPDKPEKAGRVDRPERTEKPERPERPERIIG